MIKEVERRKISKKKADYIKYRLLITRYSKEMEKERGGDCPITSRDAAFYKGYRKGIEHCCSIIDSIVEGK